MPNDVRNLVLDHLVSDIAEKGNHVATGIIGTAQLYPLLSDNGYHDLALQIVTSIIYPSYGFKFNNPYENTATLWELWNAPFEKPGMNSRDHIMFRSVGAWFYSHLAGIDLTPNPQVIRPRMASERKKHLLLKVDCQLSTLHGLAHVAYTCDEQEVTRNSLRLRLNIPGNARARFIFEPVFSGAQCVKLIERNETIWPIEERSSTGEDSIE